MHNKYDPGFGKSIQWDIPLLDGYEYEWVENIAKEPGSHHFKGIDNPHLIKLVKAWNADAVLVYGWSFKSHLKAMRYFKGKIPVYFRGDSVLLKKENWLKFALRKIFLSWVYSHIDIALYVGTHNKTYFKKSGLKEKQLVFAPHAIDNKRFFATEDMSPMALNWKEELGIKTSDRILLYAGKLDENKNTRMLTDIFLEVNEPSCHLVIAGSGVCEEGLKKDFESRANIHFLPFQNQSQMPDLYSMADIFVLPSISETWGLSINEAMASGKPVLVSDACGAAIDLVKDGINGYVFRSNHKHDLKEKMHHLLHPATDLKQMGAASLSIIKDWNYDKDAEAIESLFY